MTVPELNIVKCGLFKGELGLALIDDTTHKHHSLQQTYTTEVPESSKKFR